MKNKGFYWHLHHDTLVEWCYDAKGRRKAIRESKPPNEVPTRLELFKIVEGKLPVEFVKAWMAREKAWKAWEKAWEAWEAWEKSWKAWEKAWEAWKKAREAWENAYKKHFPKLKKLHKKECGCGWTEEKGIKFGGKDG